ncbi:Flp pilus assembly complex ATPase component TadA, partial [Listeria monocytogenes]|nr:Flp pilus assembly complex ATPase component TadA [Listeria monocytogenes]
PTAFGEKMVMRIFDPEVLLKSFDPLGFSADDLRRWQSMTSQPNGIILVTGPTGSGKTTQLPKICLELGRGIHGQIGHTQPRRLAARRVATRGAEEIGTPLGALVGYQVRFED